MRMRRSLTLRFSRSNVKAASISLSSPGGVMGLRAEYANLRAGRRYCAACSEHRVNTTERKTVNAAGYGAEYG